MDDLTVRTGRAVDGKFYTDSVADQAVREACARGSKWPLRARSLPWKRWASSPHPTRAETFRGLESGGLVRGLFAASLKGARGVSAAFV